MAYGSITTARFRLQMIKELLRNITVSQETGDRLGVPPSELEKWAHQLAEELEQCQCRPGTPGRDFPAGAEKLSQREVRFLMGSNGQK